MAINKFFRGIVFGKPCAHDVTLGSVFRHQHAPVEQLILPINTDIVK